MGISRKRMNGFFMVNVQCVYDSLKHIWRKRDGSRNFNRGFGGGSPGWRRKWGCGGRTPRS